ncbi:MAG: Lrp/AsnC family transcriptional regulator [Dongiaceae bacterium]
MNSAITPEAVLERALLDEFQRNFPLEPRPYEMLAERFGTSEETILSVLRSLTEDGRISRIGAIVTPHSAGWSTLAAMAVPGSRLTEIAGLVSSFPEVNHNYEREHRLNLWFVVTGEDRAHVASVLEEIEARSGLTVIDLPLLESFCLDLGFPLQWS